MVISGVTIVGTDFIDRVSGLGGNDTINVGGGDNLVLAGDGNDQVTGGGGADQISAGYSGSNQFDGGAGDDVIGMSRVLSLWNNHGAVASGYSNTFEGGTGNDRLEGWTGSDTYVFNRGDGQDVINDYDAGYNYSSGTQAFGKTDRITFGDGIVSDELWFSREANDLIIDTVGIDDQVRIENWYASSVYQIEQIQSSNAVLVNNQVDQLVNAMAVFEVPTGVGAVVPQDVKDQLAPVLASSWLSSV